MNQWLWIQWPSQIPGSQQAKVAKHVYTIHPSVREKQVSTSGSWEWISQVQRSFQLGLVCSCWARSTLVISDEEEENSQITLCKNVTCMCKTFDELFRVFKLWSSFVAKNNILENMQILLSYFTNTQSFDFCHYIWFRAVYICAQVGHHKKISSISSVHGLSERSW